MFSFFSKQFSSADSEEEKRVDISDIDLAIDLYRERRRPSVEELEAVKQHLKPVFVSLPEPRRGGWSPPHTRVSYPNYSVSYGSMTDSPITPSVMLTLDEARRNTNNKKISSTLTMLNVICYFLGIGVLALPWAFSMLGWCAVPFMIIFGLLHTSTAMLLAWCQRSLRYAQTYQEIADVAFGLRGRTIVGCLSYLIILLDLVIYLHLFSVTIASFDGHPGAWADAALASTIVFTLMNNICALGSVCMLHRYLAVAGALTSISLTAMLVYDLGSQVNSLAKHFSRWPDVSILPEEFFKGPHSMVNTFGVFAYSWSGHGALPSLVSKMQRPEDFNTVVAIAFAFITACYIIIGSLGYVLYDPIGPYGDAYIYYFLDTKGLLLWDVVIKALVMTVLVSKSIIALQPLIDSAVQFFKPRADHVFLKCLLGEAAVESEQDEYSLSGHSGSILSHTERLTLQSRQKKFKAILRFAIRTILPFVVLGIALLQPLKTMASLLCCAGSVCILSNVVIPLMLTLEIQKYQLGWMEKVACRFVAGIVLFMATISLWHYLTL